MPTPAALLLDIDGHLTEGVGGPAYPGGPEAVTALSKRFPLRYVTNATSRTRRELAEALRREGYPAPEELVVTPVAAAARLLGERGEARGILISDELDRYDLKWFEQIENPADAKAVLIASEAHARTIGQLRPALEALLAGARLYTLQQNRVFRRGGELLTDLGPVAAFLGYAADVTWECFGKPSPLLFESLTSDLGVPLERLLMAGDDAEFDCSGALRAGVGSSVLARTGKYRPGDESRVTPPPTHVVDSIADLPGLIDSLA